MSKLQLLNDAYNLLSFSRNKAPFGKGYYWSKFQLYIKYERLNSSRGVHPPLPTIDTFL